VLQDFDGEEPPDARTKTLEKALEETRTELAKLLDLDEMSR